MIQPLRAAASQAPISPKMSSSLPPSSAALLDIVRGHAAVAEAAWRSGDPAQLGDGLRACDEALTQVQSGVVKAGPEDAVVLPVALAEVAQHVWLQRGHMLDALASVNGETKWVVEALRSYDQAIGLGRQLSAESGFMAVAWISRGKGLQRLGSPEALTEALRCYDETIAVVGSPGADMPIELRNTLGAALMGKAGLLQRRGEIAGPSGATQALEQAVACLKACGDHPMARRNLASAWTNLGHVLQEAGEIAAAVDAQVQASAIMDSLFVLDPEAVRVERATILLNLGQAQCAAQDTAAGLGNLRVAITSVVARAATDPAAADTVLRARHALGVTLGAQLAAASPGEAARSAWLAEAGDAVEEGMALLTEWGERAGWFAAIGNRLYDFGAWLYRTQQPQFLGEFLLEHLGDDPHRAKTAAAAIQATREAITQRSFTGVAHGAMERALDVLQAMGEVETRLKSLTVPAGAA